MDSPDVVVSLAAEFTGASVRMEYPEDAYVEVHERVDELGEVRLFVEVRLPDGV